MGIPPSALGKIGEGRLFEIITVLGRGEFVCYTPWSDFEGNDFLVKRRWKAGTLAIQVKTRDYHDKHNNLTLAIDENDLPEADPKLIVLFDYDVEKADLGEFCWAFPDSVFRARSTLSNGKYEATFSRKRTAVGRWVDYRYNPADLPWVVAWYLDGERAAPAARWMAPPRMPERTKPKSTRGSRPRRARRRGA